MHIRNVNFSSYVGRNFVKEKNMKVLLWFWSTYEGHNVSHYTWLMVISFVISDDDDDDEHLMLY
jgi:hypothetical protein